MTKGLQRSLSRAPIGRQSAALIRQLIPLNALAMTVDGATGVGWGTVVAGGLPEGNLILQDVVAYLSFAGSGADAGLVDTWAGDYGVGTTPADDGTITVGDVDLVASTALAAATAEVSPRTRGVGAGQALIDNTAGTLEVNVNLLIDDLDISADSIPITVTGEIELFYSIAGDD